MKPIPSKIVFFLFLLPIILLSRSVNGQNIIIPGAWKTDSYFSSLGGDRAIGVVANASSMIGEKHLIDSMISAGINVKKIFAPEHGFRGEAEAGEFIQNTIDEKTGLPIIYLNGN